MGEHVVLVTGSSGLIGSRFIERAPAEAVVVGFDNHGPPEPPVRAEAVPVDLTSERSLSRGVERLRHAYGSELASVVHLAAYYDFSGDDSPLYEELTVHGTRRLLELLQSGGFRVGQFQFSSTMLVHAPCEPGERIDEDWPIEPRWAYPRSKVAAEAVVRERHGPIPNVVLRIAGVYDEQGHSPPLTHQMQRILERRMTSHAFPGDTARGQAFVHLDDVDAEWLAVQRRQALPHELTLLIGEPRAVSYDELQRAFALRGRSGGAPVLAPRQDPGALRRLELISPLTGAIAWLGVESGPGACRSPVSNPAPSG